MAKKYITKKELRALDKKFKALNEGCREVYLKVAQLYFHYLGTPITEENGEKLPLDPKYNEREDLKDPTIDVVVLTDEGTLDVYYNKESKKWHMYYFHMPITPFENKFILEEDFRRMEAFIVKILLGISVLEDVDRYFQEFTSKFDELYNTEQS